ncbi:TPA: hypothetical protein DCX16_04415 [bacterium]|nr:hypothetical protein [bacterium]
MNNLKKPLFYEELENAWAQLAAIREIETKAFFLSLDESIDFCLGKILFFLGIEKGFWLCKEENNWEISVLKGIEREEVEGILNQINLEDRKTIRVFGLMSMPLIWEGEVIDRINLLKNGEFTYIDEKKVLPIVRTALYVIQSIRYQKELHQLSTSIGHRIGTRLVSLGTANLILSQMLTRFEHDIQKKVDDIDRIIQETREILEDFAGLLKPLSLNIQEINMAMLINDVIDETRINSYCEISLENVIIQGDYNKLKEVFLELINNAKSFLPKQEGRIEITLQSKNNSIEITVADNGQGIPFENKKKIFSSFFTTKEGKTGLGLCIVKRFIDAHKGKIREEGIPGEGAKFAILLPKKGS